MASPHILAVMSLTGAGKSTFVKLVTGNSSVVVGNSLSSQTQDISSYPVTIHGREFCIVDTSGFEDEHRSDTEILRLLVDWLASSYRAGQKLSGILYLYRMDETRMKGSSLRNLNMFKQLCGDEFYKNLTLGTTCWSLVPRSTAESRETQLKDDMVFWKSMLSKGARLERIPDNASDARSLVYKIASGDAMATRTQKDVVDRRISFNNLAVTQTVQRELDEVRDDYASRISTARARQASLWATARQEQARRREQIAYEAKLQRIQHHLDVQRNCRCSPPARSRYCSKGSCLEKLQHWSVNYHCCSCSGMGYWHCGRCGMYCGNDEHPVMTRWEDPPHDDCVLM